MKARLSLLAAALIVAASCSKSNTQITVMQLNTWMEATTVDGARDALIEEIATHQPDILTISEGDFNGIGFFTALADCMRERGITYYTSDTHDTGILSRFPILEINQIEGATQINRALVEVDGRCIAIYSGHLDYLHYACYDARGYDGYTWEYNGNIPSSAEEIVALNEKSRRDEELAAFLASAEKDIADGYSIIFAGDFNEPSHLDWTEETAQLYDHNGFVVPWTVSTGLLENGFLDAYREVYPDPVTCPGFTFPSDNQAMEVSSLTWAPDVDERERIDYIYFLNDGSLAPVEAAVWGPDASIIRGDRAWESTADRFIRPVGIWPSDHKGVMARFTVKPAKSGSVRTSSPDGRLSMTVSNAGGRLRYSVEYDGKTVISPSALGLDMDGACFGDQVKIVKSRTKTVRDSYDLPVGKVSHVDAVCRETTIDLSDEVRLQLVVRVYNDGAAFRYMIPDQKEMHSLGLHAERMDIRFATEAEATVLPLPDFHNSHEGNYLVSSTKELPKDYLFDLPATFQTGEEVFVSFTEADVRDYAGMYLTHSGDALTSRLSPRLDRPEYCVISELPHHSPWRVFSVSDRIETIMESNILTSLAEPCTIGDTSWLKPGKTTFNWWCATQVPDSIHAGNNFETSRYYIDFAAEFGIEYHSVFGYGDEPWYVDSVMGFSSCGPDADLTRTVPELDFPAVCAYAASKGVDIHVWTNWKALYQNIDANFDKFNEWGVKGMMVDFMDRDDQEMIQIQEEILRKAAEHRLFVQFHGSSKPSGLSRTYPNEFTREGTLNYEVYKWHSDRLGADHDIHMPFTRVLAGPADYHLGGFRSAPSASLVPDYFKPVVTCTRCHMLAMYLVLESYLHMVADYPDNYRGEPGAEFLSMVPTTWDETRVPMARLNEYEVVARRSGGDWYMGAISNHEGRSLEVSLDFLGEGTYELTWYRDAEDVATNPNHLEKVCMKVTRSDTLTLDIAPDGGGAALIFKK